MFSNRHKGFSLVELAIVILIMGLILGGLAMPLATQRDNARDRENIQKLRDIESALVGFALANGFLPCPATPGSGGNADPASGNCSVAHGFVPATTLGLDGPRNSDNLLLDAWGSPMRFSVSASDADGDGSWDFTTPGQMQAVTMAVLSPDLAVCSTAAGASANACASPNLTLSAQAPAIIYSFGKDWSSFSSPDQVENAGATLGGGPSGSSYPVAANTVFVSRGKSNASGSEFDDALLWLSPNDLYKRMLDAGRLP